MTIRYVSKSVKGFSIRCVANCTRCGRPYAAGTPKDVATVVHAMTIPAFMREKPSHRHVCPQCKDFLVDKFLARCGNDRQSIVEELRLIRPSGACSPVGAP